MHFGNSLAAWGDALLCSQRTFSRRAALGTAGVVAAYTVWIQVVRQVTGVRCYEAMRTRGSASDASGVPPAAQQAAHECAPPLSVAAGT